MSVARGVVVAVLCAVTVSSVSSLTLAKAFLRAAASFLFRRAVARLSIVLGVVSPLSFESTLGSKLKGLLRRLSRGSVTSANQRPKSRIHSGLPCLRSGAGRGGNSLEMFNVSLEDGTFSDL
jgi:hypothetical protein